MEVYLQSVHEDDVFSIVKESFADIPFRALEIDLVELKARNIQLFKDLSFRMNVWIERPKWVEALNNVQKAVIKSSVNNSMQDYYSFKENFPVTFVRLPRPEHDYQPHKKLWNLVQIKGNVVRTRERGKKEVVQEHKCRKCKVSTDIDADRMFNFHFVDPKCKTAGCKGSMFNVNNEKDDANLKHYIEYQEIKIQPFENTTLLTVELDEELVETCFVGDRVIICGTFELRCKSGENDSFRIVLRAISACVHEDQQKMCNDPIEMNFMVNHDWLQEMAENDNDELVLRDQMVASIAPELDRLSIVKLGLLLVLCSGGSTNSSGGSTQAKMTSASTREISHLLMIGDPGVGKSQLIKAAAAISAISVKTIGYATTTAGLTAHCYREDGDIQIEAGALLKANNGVCCIDEIGYLSKEHRGSIHEVMEMQKITITNAGIRAELHTKCSIIAGMNQRNTNLPIEADNIAMERSLLSRFDLVFEMVDIKEPVNDSKILEYILDDATNVLEAQKWSTERLKMHIIVAKEMRVVMSAEATTILQQYFLYCERNDEIDVSRTTVRLFNNLERLTMCHAKLMLRTKTTIVDAVTTIMLTEATWSFGCLMPQLNVMSSHTPLGPSKQYIVEVLEKLNLEYLLDEKFSQPKKKKKKTPQPSQTSQPLTVDTIDNIFCDDDSTNEELDDKSITTQEIFSTQASQTFKESQHENSFLFTQPAPVPSSIKLSTDDIPDETDFKQPQSTSTQIEATQTTEKRKTTLFDLLASQSKEKKAKLDPTVVDPLMANLNSLAALFAGQSSDASRSLKPVAESSLEEKPSSSMDKLKKFQFNDEQESPNEPDENISSNVQNELPKKMTADEQKFMEEEFDLWGDFEPQNTE